MAFRSTHPRCSLHRHPVRIITLLLLACVCPSPQLAAQDQNHCHQAGPWPCEHSGLTAGLGAGGVDLSVDGGETGFQPGVAARFGVRLQPFRSERLRVALLGYFFATHFRGLKEDDLEGYAFSSSFDGGVRVSYRASRYLRPFVDVRTGGRTLERVEGRIVANYAGGGTGWGAGMEVPLTREGRGAEVAIYRLTGRFTTREYLYAVSSADLPYAAWTLTVSWSGPFTGITPPWR